MKKLLIASTALVATAGMASADITISGHAAAGIYSGLDYTAPVVAKFGFKTATAASTAAATMMPMVTLLAGAFTAPVASTTAAVASDVELFAKPFTTAELLVANSTKCNSSRCSSRRPG